MESESDDVSFTPISVQATRRNPDGSPASGTISFSLNAEMLNGVESVQPFPILGVLNPDGQLVAQSGQPIVLLANDDPGTTPASPSASYVVQENIDGSSNVEYSVIIPHVTTITDQNATATTGSPIVILSNVLASAAMIGTVLGGDILEGFATAPTIIAYDPTQNTITVNQDAIANGSAIAIISNAVDLSTLAQYEPAPEVVTYIPFTLNPAQTGGQVPTWNATDKRWEPATPSGDSGTTYGRLNMTLVGALSEQGFGRTFPLNLNAGAGEDGGFISAVPCLFAPEAGFSSSCSFNNIDTTLDQFDIQAQLIVADLTGTNSLQAYLTAFIPRVGPAQNWTIDWSTADITIVGSDLTWQNVGGQWVPVSAEGGIYTATLQLSGSYD